MESQSVETKDSFRKPSEIGEEIRKELERRGYRAPKQTADEEGGEQPQPLSATEGSEAEADAVQSSQPSAEAVQTLVDAEDLGEELIEDQSFDLPDTAELQLMASKIQHVEVAKEEVSAPAEGQVETQYDEPVEVVVESQGESSEALEDLPATAELDQDVLRVLDAIQSVSQGTTMEAVDGTGSELTETFLSRASHELRTPLQTINGFLELLFSGKMTDTQQVEQFVKLSYREGSYLADRIADLELASQIESGPLRISPVLLSMEQMIEESIQAFEPFTWDRPLRFEKSEEFEIPNLYGDRALLRHAFRNLIGIALKASPAGSDLYLRVMLEPNTLSIRISNETGESSMGEAPGSEYGIGHQSDESIGLYVAKKILQAHGGRLSAHRENDDLIAFQLSLPLDAQLKRSGTILITEDNAQAATLLEIALEREGYMPIRATNGLEALEIVANDSVDLVLLDVILPGMDGFEVCYRMRSSPDSASIPVVIVSAKAGDEDEAKALRVGADAYIRKPIQLAQLLVAINDLLDDGSGALEEEMVAALSPTQPLK